MYVSNSSLHTCTHTHTHTHTRYTHTTGNPVLITNSDVIGYERDLVRINSPLLSVLGSGDPQPTPNSYSWYFNDDPIFLNGIKLGENVTGIFFEVRYNTISFERIITDAVGGIYRCELRTSAGVANVIIQLNVEGKLILPLYQYTHIQLKPAHVHVHVYTHAYSTHVHLNTCTCTCTHTGSIHTYIHMYTHTYSTHMHLYMHTHTAHTHTYTCTHTQHTHTPIHMYAESAQSSICWKECPMYHVTL